MEFGTISDVIQVQILTIVLTSLSFLIVGIEELVFAGG